MAIFVWSYDLMRQIPLKFVKDVEIKGIDLLEYAAFSSLGRAPEPHFNLVLSIRLLGTAFQ